MLASLNTDDPAVRGVDIIHEYTVAAPAAGLSREQIRQAQINGLTRRSSANRKSRPHSAGCQRLITGPAAVLPGSSSDQLSVARCLADSIPNSIRVII